jgi:HlyD family secretion protein
MLGSATAVAGLGPNAAISKPTNTLMTIAQEGDLEMDADVNAVDMGGVLTGQTAKFSIDAFQPQVFSGIVRTIALQPTVTNGVTTYRVVIAVPRPDQRFRIGMPANVMLFRTVAKNVVLIPPTAVLRENGSSSVFVLHRKNGLTTTPERSGAAGGRNLSSDVVAERRVVERLAETSSADAVRKGVEPGDWVLLNASLAAARTDTMNPIETAFKPNPDPSDLQFERTTGSSDQKTSTIPGPRPKGFLQRLFNP